jgi:hypothetical protein
MSVNSVAAALRNAISKLNKPAESPVLLPKANPAGYNSNTTNGSFVSARSRAPSTNSNNSFVSASSGTAPAEVEELSSATMSAAAPTVTLSPLDILLQEFMFDMLRIITHRLSAIQTAYPGTFIFLLKGGNAVKLLHNSKKYNSEFPVTNRGAMEPLGDMDMAILINPWLPEAEFSMVYDYLFRFVEAILLEQLTFLGSDIKIDAKYYSLTNINKYIAISPKRHYKSPFSEELRELPAACPFILAGIPHLEYFNNTGAHSSDTSLWKVYLNTMGRPMELIDIAIPNKSTNLLRFEYLNYTGNIISYHSNSPSHMMKGTVADNIAIGKVQAIYNELRYILGKNLNTRTEKITKRTNYVKVLESLGATDAKYNEFLEYLKKNGIAHGGRRNTRSKKRVTKKRRSRI